MDAFDTFPLKYFLGSQLLVTSHSSLQLYGITNFETLDSKTYKTATCNLNQSYTLKIDAENMTRNNSAKKSYSKHAWNFEEKKTL